MFTNPDGSPSITAGSKCAFMNMIFAMDGEGWTPATKTLAVTYFDLSEKEGHAFAGRKYLSFRTKVSLDTISTANGVIKKSGLFSIKQRANKSVLAKPNMAAIEAEYEKYVADHAEYKRREAESWSDEDDRDEESDAGDDRNDVPEPPESGAGTTGTTCRSEDGKSDFGGRDFRLRSTEFPSHNRSKEALHRTPPYEPKEEIPGRSAPGVSAHSSEKEHACGADRHGNDPTSDNRHFQAASGDDDLNRGVEVDV
nr:hypothetical protein CIT37_07780 [Bradyrhizobium ottawaense]